jgi:hypothetical protein
VSDASNALHGALHPDVAWLADALWGGLEGVRVTDRWDPPPGWRTAERYLVASAGGRPRMLLPDDPIAGREALRANASMRAPRVRWARSAAGLAYHPAAWDLATRGRGRVGVHVAGPGVELPSRFLAEALGEVHVVLAINVRPPAPFRKPTVQVVLPGGRMLAYAKVASTEVTKLGVGREARALRALASRAGGPLLAPALLHLGSWGSREVLVTAPLPPGVRRYRAEEGPPPLDVTREVASLSDDGRSALGESVYWKDVRARAERLAPTAAGAGFDAVFAAFLDTVQDRRGGAATTFGTWHGDWSSWNLGHVEGRIAAWDWEHSTPGTPLGYDVVHFLFQTAFIGEGRPLGVAFASARARSGAWLERLDADPDAIADAHVAEVTLRYLDAMARGAGPNPRFLEGIGDVLVERATGR